MKGDERVPTDKVMDVRTLSAREFLPSPMCEFKRRTFIYDAKLLLSRHNFIKTPKFHRHPDKTFVNKGGKLEVGANLERLGGGLVDCHDPNRYRVSPDLLGTLIL